MQIPKWFIWLAGVILIPGVTLLGVLSIKTYTNETRIESLENERTTTRDALETQTEAIVKLRIEIQRLLVVSPGDVVRKLEQLEDRLDDAANARRHAASVTP
jgi:hypothetical protein